MQNVYFAEIYLFMRKTARKKPRFRAALRFMFFTG